MNWRVAMLLVSLGCISFVVTEALRSPKIMPVEEPIRAIGVPGTVIAACDGCGGSTATSTLGITRSSTTNTVAYVLMTSNGMITVSNSAIPISVASGPIRMPKLTISCDDDVCTARGFTGDMDDAKAMLEKIANRGMRIDVSVDQNCHPQRETIEPKPKQDLVADAR